MMKQNSSQLFQLHPKSSTWSHCTFFLLLSKLLLTCVLYFITSKGREIVYISGILQFQVPICNKVQLFSIFVNKALSLKTNYPLHIFYKSMSGNIQNKLIIIATMTNVIHHYINICKTQIDVQSSNPCRISMSQTLVPQIYVLFCKFSNPRPILKYMAVSHFLKLTSNVLTLTLTNKSAINLKIWK